MLLVLPGVVEGGEGRFLPVWTCYEGLGVTAGELRNNSVMRWSVCLLSLPSHIPPLTSSTYYNWDLSSNILHCEKLRTLALTGLNSPCWSRGEVNCVRTSDWLTEGYSRAAWSAHHTLSVSPLISHQTEPSNTNYQLLTYHMSWHDHQLDTKFFFLITFISEFP